jgi:enamine deaminase RidA (YjgF/YER057c/UK114 family)
MTRCCLATTLLAVCCMTATRAIAQADAPIRYVPLDAPAGMSRAVVVEGAPLVHTRQLLPLDRDGKLAGESSAKKQIEQVLGNLEAVLVAAGSDLSKLVKVNVYADSPQTADLFRQQLGKRPGAKARPAIAAVVTRLPHPGALIAVDAVAVAAEKGSEVVLQRCETLWSDKDCADAAVAPRGGWVYLSGQPEKGPLGKATAKSLATLLETVDRLKIERSRIVQLKVFVQPASSADEVLREVKRLFPGQKTPPIVFVEWIASAPVEIELIASRPLPSGKPDPTVHYYNPPGVKASPVFSRVAVVNTDRLIYISGLAARKPGKGDAQVRDVFAQLKAILAETGGDLRHLVKATYYVSDSGPNSASSALDKLRPEFFDPKRPPAASKATVRGSGYADRTLSIDMIAVGSGR